MRFQRPFDIELNLDEGEICPTCKRLAKGYKRKLNSGQARIIIWLYLHRKDWVHVNSKAPRHVLRNNEISRLKLWDLVEEHDNNDHSKKCSGVWRITQKGCEFVELKLRIPKYCIVYNNRKWDVSDEKVDIKECLGEHFNYYDLLHE